MGVDQDVRNALIRTHLTLLQREIREKNNWYTTQRVVIRKRTGRVQRTRLGCRPTYATQSGYVSIDEDTQSNFTFIDEPLSPVLA